MSELGRLLQEARTARNLSLADVEDATRIRQKYLEAMERGDFAALPQGAVARGLLRTYARFLELSVDEVMRRYSEESGDIGEDIPIAEPGKPRLVDYRPLEVELLDTRPTWTWLHWAVTAVAILVLVLAGWWYFNRPAGQTLWSAFGPAPSHTPTATATRWVVTATPKPPEPTATQPQPQIIPTSDLLPLPTPTVPPTETPTPRPTATPEVVASLAMEMRITQRAWVRVLVDGQKVEESTLEAGETRFWEAMESILIRTGNAAGVSLVLNGEDLGPMGQVGEVVERVWVVGEEGLPGSPLVSEPTSTPTPAG